MKNVYIYGRVSTTDQNIQQQVENLKVYVTEELGYSLSEVEVIRDQSTGTNTDRDGYQQLLEHVREDEADAVVVRSVSRIARNMRDLHETVGEIVEDNDTGLFIKNDGIEIPSGEDLDTRDKLLVNTLAMAAELEADMLKERTVEGLRAAQQAGKHTGRPPYGFTTTENGYLAPNEDFHAAVEAIHAVEEEGWSKRKTARHTGVPRRTIPKLIENKDRYLTEYDAPEDEGESDV